VHTKQFINYLDAYCVYSASIIVQSFILLHQHRTFWNCTHINTLPKTPLKYICWLISLCSKEEREFLNNKQNIILMTKSLFSQISNSKNKLSELHKKVYIFSKKSFSIFLSNEHSCYTKIANQSVIPNNHQVSIFRCIKGGLSWFGSRLL